MDIEHSVNRVHLMGYIHPDDEHSYPKEDKRCITFILYTYGFRSRDGKREVSSEVKHRVIAYSPWVGKVESMLQQGGLVYIEAVLYALPNQDGERPEYSNGLMMQHLQIIKPESDSHTLKDTRTQHHTVEQNTPMTDNLPDEFPDMMPMSF